MLVLQQQGFGGPAPPGTPCHCVACTVPNELLACCALQELLELVVWAGKDVVHCPNLTRHKAQRLCWCPPSEIWGS